MRVRNAGSNRMPLTMASTRITHCAEEEFAHAVTAPWRMRDGWKPLLLYLRGPGDPTGFFSPLLSLVGLWRFSRAPRRLADVDPAWLAGATVVRTDTNLGSYGMGGPGFAGIELKTANGATTWVVFTLWGASHWLTLENLRALDDLAGAAFASARIDRDGARIEFTSARGPAALELRRDSSHLPPFGGSGEPRVIDAAEDVRDAIRVSRRASLWVG
jgi:hypothetical protein